MSSAIYNMVERLNSVETLCDKILNDAANESIHVQVIAARFWNACKAATYLAESELEEIIQDDHSG